MLLDEYITVKWHNKIRKRLEERGYEFTNYGDDITIKVEDLTPQSNKLVRVKCDICGTEREMKYQNYQKDIKFDGLYYCPKCSPIKLKKVNLEKYGVESLLCIKKVREQGMLDKYGYTNPSLDPNWKEKYKKICQEKYGVDNVFQLDEIKEKSKQTSIERYGVPYHFQNEEEKDKWCREDKNPTWNGGTSFKNKRLDKDKLLTKWRNEVYQRDHFICQICHKHSENGLNAHHLNGWNCFENQRYDVDNGITLCKKCHMNFHNKYGYGNNTKEQFIEFKESVETKESDKIS